MAAYCTTADLLNGGIPLPEYLDPAKYVQDAADEIDSKIGLRYITPISMAESGETAVPRPVRLFLKRTNAFLATGRLLLAVASPDERNQVHAYGRSLIEEATKALDAIASGEVSLTDVPEVNDGADAPITAPLISNLDSESSVEAFYDRIGNPNYFYSPPSGVRYPHDGFVN